MILEHHYSDDIQGKKIAMLGIVPPPFGGVSVHIRRVADKLINQHNTVCFFSIEQPLRHVMLIVYMLKLFIWLLWHRPQIVYYHGTYIKNCYGDLLVLYFFNRLKEIELVIIEHDCRHLYKRTKAFAWLYRKITEIALVILIGNRTLQSYKDNEIPLRNFQVEGAFIPPVKSMASIVKESYPSSLFTFIKQFTPIILINAAHIMIIDGKDIYGLDSTVEMLACIKNDFPDAGLIIAIAQVNDQAYLDKLFLRMKQLNIAPQVFILQGQKELWPLFAYVDLFVRPTLSDGASISLDEACYFNVPSVASDVCKRPVETKMFKTGDLSDFVQVVEQQLGLLYCTAKEFSYSSRV